MLRSFDTSLETVHSRFYSSLCFKCRTANENWNVPRAPIVSQTMTTMSGSTTERSGASGIYRPIGYTTLSISVALMCTELQMNEKEEGIAVILTLLYR
jgi:hypothetical protein